MSLADILPNLKKARKTGKNNWIACCPAHEDKSPSLTLMENAEGKVVVKCHAECSFEAIVSAVGLGWDPWYPPKQAGDYSAPIRRPFPAADILEAMAHELQVVTITLGDLREGRVVSESDYERVWTARRRIEEARRLATSGHNVKGPAVDKTKVWWA